jgi:hypothetical protein
MWADLFPPHRLERGAFFAKLHSLRAARDSSAVLDYWRFLAEEGTMYNIQYALEPEDHWKAEVLIYSMAAFLDYSSYRELKHMLGLSHGHILEFVFALTATTTNMDIVRYFIEVNQSPRHHSPRIIKWFIGIAKGQLDKALGAKLTENCANAVCRWVNTQQKKKHRKAKKAKDPEVLAELLPCHVPASVYGG